MYVYYYYYSFFSPYIYFINLNCADRSWQKNWYKKNKHENNSFTVNNTVKLVTSSQLKSFLHTNGTFYAKWSTCSLSFLEAHHENESSVRPRTENKQSLELQLSAVKGCGLTRTSQRSHTDVLAHTHITTAPLRCTVNVCVNAIWTTTDAFKPLSGLLSPVAFPSPQRLLTFCRVLVSSQPFTSHSPYTTHTRFLSPKTLPFISPVALGVNNSVCWIMLCEEKQPSLCKPSCYRSCHQALRQSVGYGPTGLLWRCGLRFTSVCF